MKLMLVDDSIVVRNILRNILSQDPEIEIVAESSNGEDAITQASRHKPDFIIMDIDMPIMDGLEATRQIMQRNPVPIMVFSRSDDEKAAFKAIKNGACDFTAKPALEKLNDSLYIKNFIEKIKLLSQQSLKTSAGGSASPVEMMSSVQNEGFDVLVVGASTGGPVAVSEFFTALPKNLSVPVVLVQHIETGFDRGYANWLSQETGKRVVLAEHGTPLQSALYYVAPTDKHLVFNGTLLALNDGAKVINQKPSVDVLFCSAASTFGPRALAVLLTGMGTDGADGCVAVRKAGGVTLVQDKDSSLIFGMPRAAIEKGGATMVLPLSLMAKKVQELLSGGVRQ